jgi:hypothetical protein
LRPAAGYQVGFGVGVTLPEVGEGVDIGIGVGVGIGGSEVGVGTSSVAEIGTSVAGGIVAVPHPVTTSIAVTHKPGVSNLNLLPVRDVTFLKLKFCLLTIFMITYACLGKEGRQI